MPKVNEFGIEEEIDPEEIKVKLEENEDIKLVILTSPTYEGVISDIEQIAKISHEYSVPVLVDEAHGAHLNFDKKLRKYEALNVGADIVIQSLHKTLPSLTQTAIMHINGELINENKLKTQLAIFETSSPSYILMSSIQECLNTIETNQGELFEKYDERLEKFYEQAKTLEKLKVLGSSINATYDKGKIVVITKNTNITGKQLAQILRKDYKIETEMSSVNYVIAMTSICDSKENFERLITALREIDKRLEKHVDSEEDYTIKIPEKAKSINEAIYFENTQTIDIQEAAGKVSKEYIWVYPPGIPIVTPGEVIDENIIKKLLNIEKANIEVRTSFGNFPNIDVLNEKFL